MADSTLVTYEKLSPNCTKPRKNSIDRLTIHCVVGQLTAKQILNLPRFTTYDPDNGASCNYAVGTDGSIGQGVLEANRSWCSSSKENDMRAITIEVASDTFQPYQVNEKAYKALISLVIDIMKRNGKTHLIWDPSKAYALAYKPAPNEMIMTVHRWFANKACPGDYLYNLHPQIAETVTAALSPRPAEPVHHWYDDDAAWVKELGIADGTRPTDKASRAEVWAMLHRLYNIIKEEDKA